MEMDEERMSILPFHMLPVWGMAVSLAIHLAAGIGLGIAYFSAVWWNARLFALGGRASTTIALTIGRLVVLGGLLALASLEGALPLLAMALGVLIARPLVMRRHMVAAP
jgi:F1F0 ATPase subunit 2